MPKLLLFFIVCSMTLYAFSESNKTNSIQENEVEEFSELEGFSELDGFNDFEDSEGIDVDTTSSNEKSDIEENSFVNISGNIAFKSSLGYKKHNVSGVEYSGLNQAQSSIYLQSDGKLNDNWKYLMSADAFYDAIYDLHATNVYRSNVIDTYKTQLRFDDVYIEGEIFHNVDAKIGRQIVVWGKSDTIRITDVINPIDNRLPGMVDIEDLRLSVAMAKLDYYIGSWNVSAMVIVENRKMLEAAPRGEFFDVNSIFNVDNLAGLPDPFPPLAVPSSSIENLQYAMSINGVFSGWDISFYAADVLDQKWHFENMQVALDKRLISKVKMLGSATNIAVGSVLLKAEMAFLKGVKYNNTQNAKERLDVLLGIDYMGFSDTLVSLEIANRHIFSYENKMAFQADFVDEDELQTALRVSKTFANDTLSINALASLFGRRFDNGGFVRLWSEYDVIDNVSINGGVIDYIGGKKPYLEAIKDNDRVFIEIEYSF